MNYCELCGTPTKKPINRFCSVACKSKMPVKKVALDPTINIRCKIDGKVFSDHLNGSGTLTRYSKNVLKKEFDWNDWEKFDVELKPTWNCPYCSWTTIDVTNKSGCITTHLEEIHGETPETHSEKHPTDKELWQQYWKELEASNFLEESEDNRVQCLECGEFFKKLSNTHLLNAHNMTLFQYKKKHKGAKTISTTTTNKSREIYFSDDGLSKVNPNSNAQLELDEFIRSLGFDTICPKRFRLYDIDVYLPDLKIGFEYHGLFYHSQFRGNHLQSRHLDAVNAAEADGIQLIQIFEDEWKLKNEIIKSRIKNILGISEQKTSARKCAIRELTNGETKEFLDLNHLQGYQRASISIGLFYNTELIQCMTFTDINDRVSGNSKSEPGIFENVRSCIKMGWNVSGGFARILKYFELAYNPSMMIGFADRRWSSLVRGTYYDRLGFEFNSTTRPCFWAMRGYTRRQHRSSFTKKKMLASYPEIFEEFDINELTQFKMIEMMGYDIIWDCGNLKYIKTYNAPKNIPVTDADGLDIVDDNFVRENRKRTEQLNRYDPDKLILCIPCNQWFPLNGMASHVHQTHKQEIDEFVRIHGEYRPKQMLLEKRLVEAGDAFECLECNERQVSNKQLVQHINKKHGSFDQYAIKYFFNGEHPTCECGCGEKVSLKSQPPYKSDFISGHNPNGMIGKKHKLESRRKQKEKSIGRYSLEWFIGRYGDAIGREEYTKRNKKISNSNKH